MLMLMFNVVNILLALLRGKHAESYDIGCYTNLRKLRHIVLRLLITTVKKIHESFLQVQRTFLYYNYEKPLLFYSI